MVSRTRKVTDMVFRHSEGFVPVITWAGVGTNYVTGTVRQRVVVDEKWNDEFNETEYIRETDPQPLYQVCITPESFTVIVLREIDVTGLRADLAN